MEKHLVAATFLRLAMKKAERIFQLTPRLLAQFEHEMTQEILALLDKILERKLL